MRAKIYGRTQIVAHVGQSLVTHVVGLVEHTPGIRTDAYHGPV